MREMRFLPTVTRFLPTVMRESHRDRPNPKQRKHITKVGLTIRLGGIRLLGGFSGESTTSADMPIGRQVRRRLFRR